MKIENAIQFEITAPESFLVSQGKKLSAAFMTVLLASTVLLFGLRDFPVIALLLIDTLFCSFCAYALVHRLRYLFLLYPISV